ncbi:class III lanthionine synthetase LanKC [Bacillus carboniphilus]|uniref:Class III lanthionine synthetase LanKC n=1 Tax=Bacillus carboniphilus TaxID=86663 RepID=A0ABY9JT92_9BACI|nr:class III lanthionine synthetase LanKC [Bacillus carboniphilus]WLR42604.1 class III lanthionine synthetase LanKC [Bacillus carboniphilus]
MEEHLLYHQYMKPNSEFFGKSNVTKKDNSYELKELPTNYEVISENNSDWIYYHPKDSVLPEQGWKIHVTSSFEDAQAILNKVGHLCIDKMVGFKHLKDQQSFMKMNSKNANRATSGKFITIYPINNEVFVELLDTLSLLTTSFKKGPYILNDKRWKNSNIFYRYGAFKSILNEKGEHCIRDKQGNLIRDQRVPFYQVPDFVKDFDDYLHTLNKCEEPETKEDSNLERYQIETALSFSNAGGIYLATRKKDNLKVIIKEARPNAGLDGMKKDALERQKIEYNALKTLKDVPGVVQLIDYFKEWEHYFLVEEFIEGSDLRQWLSKEFPFFRGGNHLSFHAEKVKKIVSQLMILVEKMHSNGIAMGDLQPTNVMVTDDLTVSIIDFETAMSIDSQDKPNMETIGFSSREIKVSGARDWYGLKRLIRYLALPVLSSEDLEIYLQDNHLNWIKENYEEPFYKFIVASQEKCNEKMKHFQEDHFKEIHLSYRTSDFNLTSITNKLIRGIENNLTKDERFINGDIRQFEMESGKFNFLSGGTGAAFTLTKNKSSTYEVDNWISNYLLNNLHTIQENGLFTGKAGIFALLYDKGYEEIVFNELKYLKDTTNKTDISLRSGLSGIGLFVISLYLETKNTEYLKLAMEIEEWIEKNRVQGKPLKTNDWMAVDIGAIDGLSGVSLFYSALYSSTNNKKYLEKATFFLKEDLKSTKKDELIGVLQTIDNRNQLLPYLSGGTVGVAIAIWFLNHVSGQNLFIDEMDSIIKVSKIRCTISGGLFDGAGSFLLIPPLVKDQQKKEEITNNVVELMNLFLIQKDDFYVYPGQFSYRLSDDVYTGSSGIILALMGVVKDNPLYWLPLVNSDEFLARTQSKNRSKVNAKG